MRQLILFGDSRVYGAGDFAAQDYLGVPYPLLPNYYGTGYLASDVLTVTLTGGHGTGGVLAAVGNADGSASVYPVTRGSGYHGSSTAAPADGLPVITVSGGSGTPVSFNYSNPSTSAQAAAGGFLVPMEAAIRQAAGFSDFVLNNAAQSGALTVTLTPGGANTVTLLDMAVSPARTPYLWCNLGINDYATGVTPQQYHDRYASLLTQLTNLGYKVFIDKFFSISPSATGAAAATTAIVANWHPVIDTLIAAYPGKVFLGSDDNAVFQAHPEYYFDPLHPNGVGDAFLASSKAARFLQLAVPLASTPPAAPASLSAAAPQASAVLTWPAAQTATGYRVRRDGVTTPIYDGAGLTLTDTFALGTSHTYTVAAYNTAGESALTTPATATALTTGLSLTVTPGTGVNNLAWFSDQLAVNGYAILWMPGSALPGVGATGEVVGRTTQGTLTWADTSAYRIALSSGSRYQVIALH